MCSHQRPENQGNPSSSSTPRHSYPEFGVGPGNKWIKSLTNERTGGFTGGRYSDLNLSAVLFTERKDSKEFVELKVWSAPGRSKPSFEEAMSKEFVPAKKGQQFGPSCMFERQAYDLLVLMRYRDESLVASHDTHSDLVDKV